MVGLATICGIIAVTAMLSLIGDAAEAAVIAGVFSTINTVLNIILVKRQGSTLSRIDDMHTDVEAAKEVAAKVVEVVPLRRTDVPDKLDRRRSDYTE